MQSIEYHTVDKSEWGDGPWQQEPDKKQWQDKATGLPCLIVRGPSGALCGYVGVSRRHPAYGKSYDDVDVRVHGGLTFANTCAEEPTREKWEQWRAAAFARRQEAEQYPRGDCARLLRDRAVELQDYDAFVRWSEAAKICHKVEAREDDNVWWLGFDCAHAGDISPAFDHLTKLSQLKTAMVTDSRWPADEYRDMAYVTRECEDLAKQLVELGRPAPRPLDRLAKRIWKGATG